MGLLLRRRCGIGMVGRIGRGLRLLGKPQFVEYNQTRVPSALQALVRPVVYSHSSQAIFNELFSRSSRSSECIPSRRG